MNKEKISPRYSMWNNIGFIIRQAWRIDNRLVILTFLQSPVLVLLPLLGSYLSASVVRLVAEDGVPFQLIETILLLSFGMLILRVMQDYMNSKIEWAAFKNRFSYISICSRKVMDMDYENIEAPAGQTRMQKAFNCLYNNNSGTQKIFSQLVNLLSNVGGLITLSVLLLNVNPWIVVFLFVLTVGNYFIIRKNTVWLHRNKDNWVPIERKLKYIQKRASDFEMAKDIRLYNMVPWLKSLVNTSICQRMVWCKKSEKYGMTLSFLSALIAFVRDGIAYYVLISLALSGHLTLSDFVFYFGLIRQYYTWLMGIFNSYNAIHATSLDLNDFREFLDMPDHFNRGVGVQLPEVAPGIVFKDVSYRYSSSDKDTLKNLNFSIKPGEKIAIVGLNGAGKTTLVKLLSGLYAPTKGSITVGEQSIPEYCIYEYFSIISAVFQDILFLPTSVSKNIALKEEKDIDYDRVEQVLKLSGMFKKVESLPQKANTVILKSVVDGAVDLSGGEKQKLALARALYQNGKIMLLDEPTAALDPIAENEVYQKYFELTKVSTSVFISHRLSSTRFCDRILFLENGEIVEEGSHSQLMSLNGKYAKLYEVQSQYYKE